MLVLVTKCISLVLNNQNSTELQLKSPPTRPTPFFMIKFLHRALELFQDITKKSLISVIFATWSRHCSLKLDGLRMLQKSAVGPREGTSVVPQIAASMLVATMVISFSTWCSFSFTWQNLKGEKFLAHVLRKALSWAHHGGLPSTAKADKNYWSRQTLAQ